MGKQELSWWARWSEALANKGMTPVSNTFMDLYSALGITTGEAMFIIHCFEYKWSVDDPFPSLETIATKMGKDCGSVQRFARQLEEKGFIDRRYSAGHSSKIAFKSLILLLEHLAPYSKMNREDIQKCVKVYSKLYTKEETPKKGIKKEGLINDLNDFV